MTILPASARPLAAPRVSAWRQKPVIYEINTWVWLRQLSHKYQREISLATVPTPELDSLADWGFDAVWLMGVWHRGPATRRSALNYLHEYRGALPDISEADVPGSAFAIADYRVDARLGGRDGLAALRRRLAQRDIKLLLDFVPNHVATDHAWTRERPEFFIQGSAADLEKSPDDFLAPDGQTTVIARGRDPYFPAWIDTAQLNAFAPGLRRAWIETLIDIGRQCDGLRCDMAMLMMNDVSPRLGANALERRQRWISGARSCRLSAPFTRACSSSPRFIGGASAICRRKASILLMTRASMIS